MTLGRLLLVLAAVAYSAAGLAEDSFQERRPDIEQLLEVTGALAIGQQMNAAIVGQMTQLIRQVRPDIPEETLAVIPEEVNGVLSENTDTLMGAMITLYAKYYTAAEIKEMLRFYESPLGKKTIRVMPALMAEGMQAGQLWGQSLGPIIERRIRARFKEEGVEL